MAYKPGMIDRSAPLAPKAISRLARDAKKASARLARRAARLDPEGAPTSRITRGWAD